MSSQGPIQSRGRYADRFPIVFSNASGETIPAHAIMQVAGASGVPYGNAQLITVAKPSSGSAQYIINGPFAVAAGAKGRGRVASLFVVSYTGSTPSLGTTIGPTAGSWDVSTLGTGFVSYGGAGSGVVLAGIAPVTGSSTPPLRRFECTSAKDATTATVLAKWLDNDGNMVGDEFTLYDPNGFHCEAANYVGTIDGFRGVALERTDLAVSSPDAPRWEIVEMEGFAGWVIVEYHGSPDNVWKLTTDGFGGDAWDFKRPVANAATLTISDPLSGFPSPQDGEQAYAELVNPDTSPPTYAIRSHRGGTVRVTEGDSVPNYLHYSLNDTATFDSDEDPVIKGEVVGAAGTDQKERLFLDASAITGYSAAGKRVLMLDAGVIKWLELTETTINNPTSLELNLPTGTLESKLNYTPTTVLIVSTSTAASFTDTVATDDCA